MVTGFIGVPWPYYVARGTWKLTCAVTVGQGGNPPWISSISSNNGKYSNEGAEQRGNALR